MRGEANPLLTLFNAFAIIIYQAIWAMDSLHHGPLYGDFLLSISIMQEKRYESKKYHRKMDVYIKRPFLKESNPEDNS
jgi:hypothetical protein